MPGVTAEKIFGLWREVSSLRDSRGFRKFSRHCRAGLSYAAPPGLRFGDPECGAAVRYPERRGRGSEILSAGAAVRRS